MLSKEATNTKLTSSTFSTWVDHTN